MKKNNIRYFIAARTFPWLIGLLALSSALLFLIAKIVIDNQSLARHQQIIDRFSGHVDTTLASLEQQVTNIANNELIINSLIDPQGRESYIPLFIRSFSLAGIDRAYLGVTDFSGNILAKNDVPVTAELYELEQWQRMTLEESNVYRSFTQSGLIVSAPIRFTDIAEGAVVATISIEYVAPLLGMNNIDDLIIYTDDRGNVLYSSNDKVITIGDHFQDQLADWFVVKSFSNESGFQIISAESKGSLYNKIYWVFIFMIAAILVAIVSMVMSVSLSSRLVSNTLDRFVGSLKRKNDTDNENNEGYESLEELTTISNQFDELASSLSEAKLLRKNIQGIINSLNEALVVFNFDGSVKMANHAFDNLLKKIAASKKDVLGKIIIEEGDVSDKRDKHSIIDKVLDSSKDIDDFECSYELNKNTKDGISAYVIRWSRSLYFSEDGLLEGIILIGADVTESREFEKELRLKDLVVEEAGNGIVIADAQQDDLPLIYCNQSFLDMSGYSREEVIGRNCRFLQGEKTDPEVVSRFRQAIANQERITETLLNYRKDGSTFYNHLMLAPIKDTANRLIYYVGIQLDVTKQVEADQALLEAKAKAEESTQLKSQFLASMSHEIRTPMNGVLGMLGLLLKTQLDERQHHYASLATSSAESLLKIINDILDFSKVEAGKMELEAIDFNLLDLLSDFSESMAQRAEEKHLEFILDVTGVRTEMLRGDPGRLRQILTNLVSNAIKFTHEGEVIVKAKLDQLNAEEYTLRCHIIDTGIGIPDDKKDTLFDSFSQVDSSTTREYGGTGLGLAIVRQLCQLMGGDVSIVDRDKGSEFEFEVRLSENENSSLIYNVPVDDVSVLIIDDNESLRNMLIKQLSDWGVQAQAPSSLDDIDTVLSSYQPFDLVLLASHFQDESARDWRATLQHYHQCEKAKWVLMSRLTSNTDTPMFDGVFPKPVTPRDLRYALSVLHDPQQSDTKSSFIYPRDHKQASSIAKGEGAFRRLLLVEDNIINQQVALGVLEGLGYSADIAANGLEAIAALKHAPQEAAYELILMDCQMPEMDGYEATRAIRHGQAPNPDIPIIAMTANAMKGDREQCLAAGMNDYLSKPIDPEALLSSLQRWLPASKYAQEDRFSVDQKESADFSAGESAVWDRAAFMQRVLENEAIADKLIHLFKQDAPKTIEQLEQAVRYGDAEAAGLVAHKLKGSVVNLGGIELAELAQEIEMAGKDNNMSAINALLPNVRPQYHRLIDSIDQSNPS